MKINNLTPIKKEVALSKKTNDNLLNRYYKFESDFDIFQAENIKNLTFAKGRVVTQILYNTPIPVQKALKNILTTKNWDIKNSFSDVTKMITNIITDLRLDSEIANTEVTALIGCGSYAIAFETKDEKVLKLSDKNHFSFNRKPANFDVPIFKMGKLGNYGTHYYLEKKLSSENLEHTELEKFCEEITSQGYYLEDILNENCIIPDFKARQFGKDENGKLYLLDPGCAIEKYPKSFGHFLKALKEYFYQIIDSRYSS